MLIVQHKGKITNIQVEVTTDDGRRVTVSSDGAMKWKRRDDDASSREKILEQLKND